MHSSELRTKYIQFFEERGHLILPSDSLVPDDPTLLFTSAGMVQFKPYFVGERVPPRTRVATCQKCLRTDDLDDVGDAFHHTFFEMLGNFSFGDYFKHDAIVWAWEFLTEVLKLDPADMWISIYLDDDEAYDVWNKVVGVSQDRIVRLGEHTNYWPADAPTKGPNGPCGPCSEIFLDMGEDYCHENICKGLECNCDRYCEMWNLVFTQFDRQEGGKMVPLPSKNIDTGAGLERISAILQGAPTDYETDLFLPLIKAIECIAGVEYGKSPKTDVPMRVVADHVRGAVFTAADGVVPSNAGRGYVVRRMIRKAILRSGALGINQNFLDQLVPVVIETMREPYPELIDRESFVINVVRAEEERFRRTLGAGVSRMEDLIASALTSGSKEIGGEAAFMLYDTYGFPVELTQEMARERGLEIDMAGFDAAMEEQRKRAREATAIPTELFGGGGGALLELQHRIGTTQFLGYEQTTSTSQIVGILKEGKLIDRAGRGEKVEVVLDQTPFYAESGGQVGDIGEIIHGDAKLTVINTLKVAEIYFHHCEVVSGEITVGMRVEVRVDESRRMDIARNHTATHLLHAALRKILGEHALQSGSVVDMNRLRFDFSHNSALSPDEIRRIEDMVNEKILDDIPVTITETTIEEARKMGATALFGEKYGETVRVITIGEYSAEFCAGTHLQRTSQVGLFKLLSESSIGAGLRRIEAVTGRGALAHIRMLEFRIFSVASALNSAPAEMEQAAQRLSSTLKDAQKQLEKLQSRGVAERAGELAKTARSIDDVSLVTGSLPTADTDALSLLADGIADKLESVVVVLAGVGDGRVAFVSKVTSDLVSRGLHAGNIIREVAKAAGGGGGGKPEFAQAGGKDPARVDAALALAADLIRAAVQK